MTLLNVVEVAGIVFAALALFVLVSAVLPRKGATLCLREPQPPSAACTDCEWLLTCRPLAAAAA